MNSFLLAVATIALLLATLMLLLPQGAAGRRRSASTAAREAGLALIPEMEPVVVRRARRARRYSGIGAVAAWVVTAAPLFSEGAGSTAGVYLCLGAMAIAGALGNALAAVVDARSASRSDRPRLARSRAVSVDDYAARFERRGPVRRAISGFAGSRHYLRRLWPQVAARLVDDEAVAR